jgi:hypothetical protein
MRVYYRTLTILKYASVTPLLIVTLSRDTKANVTQVVPNLQIFLGID